MAKTKSAGKAKDVPLYQLKVELAYAKPPIWRRVLVRGDMTLALLHAVIQVAMGWTNSHLHQFKVGNVTYADPRLDDDMGFGMPDSGNENKALLMEVAPKAKARFVYEYDFGDSWEHRITVEKILDADTASSGFATCLDGKRACPPEDCGGMGGYENLLEIIRDPAHEDHDAMLEWIGGEFDPEAFDLDQVNTYLAKLKWPRMTEDQLAGVLMKRDGMY